VACEYEAGGRRDDQTAREHVHLFSPINFPEHDLFGKPVPAFPDHALNQ
jgi:hypothetical protein